MINPLIHIGYHKTGTTWLQNTVFKDDFEGVKLLSTAAKGPCDLARLFYATPEGSLLSSFDSDINTIQEKISEIIKSKAELDGQWVLSHERLSGNPHSGGFDAQIIAERLKSRFPDGRVLIIFREQSSMLVSAYFQYLARGGVLSFKRYADRPYDGRLPHFTFEYLKYDLLISRYKKLFGESNVLALPYEMFSNQPEHFIKHISKFSGIHIDFETIDVKRRINEKSNHALNYRLRVLNYFLKSDSINGDSTLNRALFKYLAIGVRAIFKLFSSHNSDLKMKQTIAVQSKKLCGDKFIHSNSNLQRLVNIDLESFGYNISK